MRRRPRKGVLQGCSRPVSRRNRKEPIDLRRAGEGDHVDVALDQALDRGDDLHGLSLRGVAVGRHRREHGAARAQAGKQCGRAVSRIKLNADAPSR